MSDKNIFGFIKPTPLPDNPTTKPTPNTSDPINPDHYRTGDVECVDAIQSALGLDGFLKYCTGNVLKYVWRWKHKNGIEDLKKARWYLDRLIKELDNAGR